ncbi:unnamed protein product, partial [Musa hybrid cultivar]
GRKLLVLLLCLCDSGSLSLSFSFFSGSKFVMKSDRSLADGCGRTKSGGQTEQDFARGE